MNEPNRPIRMRGQSSARVTNQGAPQEEPRRRPARPPAPPVEAMPVVRTPRELAVSVVADELHEMFNQARQQRAPDLQAVTQWVEMLMDLAVELVDARFRERAERNLAARAAVSAPMRATVANALRDGGDLPPLAPTEPAPE